MISQETSHSLIAGISFIIIFLAVEKLYVGNWISQHPLSWLIAGIILFIFSNKISKMFRGSQ
ncbi:MAG: hypothetical protein AABY22_33330 [Nanoarchaeota archaeon]|mgnify:FL=1